MHAHYEEEEESEEVEEAQRVRVNLPGPREYSSAARPPRTSEPVSTSPKF